MEKNELYITRYPKSHFAESIKSVRTNLRFSSVNNDIKTLLVTSSSASEGKSFVTTNLAAAFAISGEKVLIIDCDLRRGRQQQTLGIHKNANMGLSNLLIDNEWKNNLNKYIKSTEVENLDVILSGTVPPNPSILLESEKMEEFVKYVKDKYDTIIFDTPPINGLNDTQVISKLVEATLIVVNQKKTTYDALENTKKSLENVGANIVGVILNNVDDKDKRYYNSYYYYSNKEE